ncbi:hypothetical protein ACVOMV_08095 [Mesorhizobium atlanticum]
MLVRGDAGSRRDELQRVAFRPCSDANTKMTAIVIQYGCKALSSYWRACL